jgi:hypothetical protein
MTFGTINNAYWPNLDPFPQFKFKYKKLNAHFTVDEWDYLDVLHDTVNGHLHLPLPGEDFRYLILPLDTTNCTKVKHCV